MLYSTRGGIAFALNSEGEPIIYVSNRVEEKEQNEDFQSLSQQMQNQESGMELMEMEGKKLYLAYVRVKL